MHFCFSSRRRHTRCALVTGVQTCALPISVLLAQQRIAYRDRGVLLPRNAERERIAPRRLAALALIQRQPIVALRISLGADPILRYPAFSRAFLNAIPTNLGLPAQPTRLRRPLPHHPTRGHAGLHSRIGSAAW